MFSSSEEGGGASSGPSAKMILTKSLSTLFIKKTRMARIPASRTVWKREE